MRRFTLITIIALLVAVAAAAAFQLSAAEEGVRRYPGPEAPSATP